MKKILLLSDTHSFIDDSIKKYAKKVDEIWHAGDIGNIEVYDNLKKITKTRAVYENHVYLRHQDLGIIHY